MDASHTQRDRNVLHLVELRMATPEESLPAPPIPADVDLRDSPHMPIDVMRLRYGSLTVHASGEGFRAAILLWCASWHQVPAGSLPDDDAILAHLAGFGRHVEEWRAVRAEALCDWYRCSDGRLYHPVIAERVSALWAERQALLARREAGRRRKALERARRRGESAPSPARPSTGHPTDIPRTADSHPQDVTRTSDGCHADVRRMSRGHPSDGAQMLEQSVSNHVDVIDMAAQCISCISNASSVVSAGRPQDVTRTSAGCHADVRVTHDDDMRNRSYAIDSAEEPSTAPHAESITEIKEITAQKKEEKEKKEKNQKKEKKEKKETYVLPLPLSLETEREETPLSYRPSVVHPTSPHVRDDAPPARDSRDSRDSRYSDAESELPDWLPVDAWDAYVAHRRAIRAPLTPYARRLAVRKLAELRALGEDPRAILEQSILHGWRGLFGLHRDHTHTRRRSIYDERAEFIAALTGRNRESGRYDRIIDVAPADRSD